MNPFSKLRQMPKEGDQLSAKTWRLLVQAATRTISAQGMLSTPVGDVIFPGGGSGEEPIWTFGRITLAEGASPPFVYSAEQVEYTGGGHFAAVDPAVAYDRNVFNIAEEAFPGAGKVPIGTIVVLMVDSATDEAVFSCLNYRGTYPIPA